MSGADNFQAFLASHRQEKLRVKALRAGLSATSSPAAPPTGSPAPDQPHHPSPSKQVNQATAEAPAIMGSTGPVWQPKAHPNDPRDVAAAQAAAAASAAGAAASPEPGAFTIGGQTFMPDKPPATPARGTPGAAAAGHASPRDSTSNLLKSMTSALSRVRNKDEPMSAMEELQELSRLAGMAAGTAPRERGPGGGGGGQLHDTAGGVASPNDTDRLKQQLDGMRQHLEQMHSTGGRGGSAGDDAAQTQELMTELERMRARLRHVEGGAAPARLAASGQIPQADSGGHGGGWGAPDTAVNVYPQLGEVPSSAFHSPSPKEGGVGGGGGGGEGMQRPQALMAAEARISVSYEGIELLAKAQVVLGFVLFFPGIFIPYSFGCWGISLPLMALGAIYIKFRDPELKMPVTEEGTKGTRLFMGFTMFVVVLLVIGGGFGARGADAIRALYWAPTCGTVWDCSMLPLNITAANSTDFVNETAYYCIQPEDYARQLGVCQSLSMCRGPWLIVGDCWGINGTNIFVSVLCFLSGVAILLWALWGYTVLVVRIQEHHFKSTKSPKDLEEDYEYADLSCGSFMGLLCEDWAKVVANIQRQGFGPEGAAPGNRLPVDHNDQVQRAQNRQQTEQQAQQGDHGLTAEALEARILTPPRAADQQVFNATLDRGSPGHPYTGVPTSTPGREFY